MATELTKKEKGFVKDYIETGNGTEAVLNNYDTEDENTAAVLASKMIRKDKIQNAIKSIAESIPDEDLIKVHKEGLQAVRMAGDKAEIDFGVRHKYLDSAYKLKGIYAPDKSISLNMNGNIIASEELQALANQLNEIARSNNRTSFPSDGIDSDTVDSEAQD